MSSRRGFISAWRGFATRGKKHTFQYLDFMWRFFAKCLQHTTAPLIIYCNVLVTKPTAFSKGEAYADANFSDSLINLTSGNLLIRATTLL